MPSPRPAGEADEPLVSADEADGANGAEERSALAGEATLGAAAAAQ